MAEMDKSDLKTVMETIRFHQGGKRMVDISIKLNGRKVSPNQLAKTLEGEMIKGLADEVKKSLRSCRCSTHGESPKVTIAGRSIDNLKFEVDGCCDEFLAIVQKKLA